MKTPNCRGRFGGCGGVIERETGAEGSNENVVGDGVLFPLLSSFSLNAPSFGFGLRSFAGCQRVGYKIRRLPK